MIIDKWSITQRLEKKGLDRQLTKLHAQFGGNTYRHRNGGEYIIEHFSVLSRDGGAEFAVNYCEVENGIITCYVPHTRPARDFFDGRFTLVSKSGE